MVTLHHFSAKFKSCIMASFISLLLILVSVAFFTLLERKVLAYIILRRGPNKPSFSGLLVPFADALKLLSKPFIAPSSSSPFLSRFACFLIFIIPGVLWIFAKPSSSVWDYSNAVLCVLIWISLSVYALMAAGWGSNSKYSTLGGTRCIAQCISYEVCVTLLLFGFCLVMSFAIFNKRTLWCVLLFCHLVFVLLVVILAETNRSPFDFAEGESELVSGYNVEYSGSGFVLLFLSEYLSILFMSYLTGTLTTDGSYFFTIVLVVGLAFFFIWCRGTLPRFRYDQLISLCWNGLLPVVLSSFALLLVL